MILILKALEKEYYVYTQTPWESRQDAGGHLAVLSGLSHKGHIRNLKNYIYLMHFTIFVVQSMRQESHVMCPNMVPNLHGRQTGYPGPEFLFNYT